MAFDQTLGQNMGRVRVRVWGMIIFIPTYLKVEFRFRVERLKSSDLICMYEVQDFLCILLYRASLNLLV